jgi:hypothetical protein
MESQIEPAPLDAALALQQATQAHQTLADRAKAPAWYNLTLGLLMGALTAAMAGPTWLLLTVEVLFLACIPLMVRAYRRKTGMWISGYRAGRTRVVALTMAAATLVIMCTGIWLKIERGLWQAPLFGAPLVTALVTAAGYIWQAAFRADLADQARLPAQSGDRS